MGRSMSDSMMNIHFLTILREDEFRELKKVFPHDNELLHSIRSIRYQCGQLKPSDSMANFKNTILKIF